MFTTSIHRLVYVLPHINIFTHSVQGYIYEYLGNNKGMLLSLFSEFFTTILFSSIKHAFKEQVINIRVFYDVNTILNLYSWGVVLQYEQQNINIFINYLI